MIKSSIAQCQIKLPTMSLTPNDLLPKTYELYLLTNLILIYVDSEGTFSMT